MEYGCWRSKWMWSFVVLVVIVECSCYWCEGCLDQEREVLLKIKHDINYPDGTSLLDWKGADCCKWNGVTCYNSAVHGLNLWSRRDQSLKTWYPNATLFAQFKELDYLNLGNNTIAGWIMPKGLCNLTSLQNLYLSNNELDYHNIPTCLRNLSKLEGLNLYGNNLEGNFLYSSEIFELRTLRYLNLGRNKLEGNIPPAISSLHSLEELHLPHSQLSGRIPPLGNLTSLTNIDLRRNNLEDIFEFSTIANLSKLTGVALSDNPPLQVITERPTWTPSFQLDYIGLSNCGLNKHRGSAIPSFLAAQSRLEEVYLRKNLLSGSIPSWLVYNQTELIILHLYGNSLAGPFPLPSQHDANSSILMLDISQNCIQGPLPSDINLFLPQLVYLDMSTNALEGEPSFHSITSSLRVLDLSKNMFSGEIPNNLLSNGASLQYLSLSSNKLNGDIQALHLSNITMLEHLLLDNNDLTGTIPNGLSNITNLQTLSVRGNLLNGKIPSWLPTFRNLTSLLLGGNHFIGNIPKDLCQMQKLRMLDLSNNDLSGVIPSCLNNISSWMKEATITGSHVYKLGNISASLSLRTYFTTKGTPLFYEGIPLSLMTGIDFSSNRLVGNIPQELGYLKGIRSLNLSRNSLTGAFPESFQYLKNLESLDLSHNKLTGNIPPQMTQLHFISTFTVAFNNLSGMVPFEGQFSTFNRSSYEGNPGLCGQPLERNCSTNNPPPARVQQGEGNDESGILENSLFFFSCAAISYSLGFWGSIAFLFFNKRWREKFFKTTDQWINLCGEKINGLL